ncbi:MAG TPA: hypothetical protein VJW20_07860 [Candidatus Angelobacter sp.]|nr:hypothetical protein [Candidatus Angelobacter sp.]
MVNHQNAKLTGSKAIRNLIRGLLVALVTLSVAGLASAQDDPENFVAPVLKFKGGVGVIPVTGVAANGTVNLNIVRGVNPGAPWRIAELSATIGADGHIKVLGRGLLLASGNGIGTNADQSVHATLFCGPAATATAHNSNPAGVALEADGDFRIDDFLSPLPPATCETPVLLIRNVIGLWFAAGLPQVEDADRK